MTTTQTETKTANCTRCGRKLTDPNSIALGIGPVCRRHIANAAKVIDLTAFRDAKTAKDNAVEIIEQNAIIPGPDHGTYLTPSSDGTSFYLINTTAGTCTCKGHLYTGRCKHAVAAALFEAKATTRFAKAA